MTLQQKKESYTGGRQQTIKGKSIFMKNHTLLLIALFFIPAQIALSQCGGINTAGLTIHCDETINNSLTVNGTSTFNGNISVSGNSVLGTVTSANLTAVVSTSGLSGSYLDLTNKPTINSVPSGSLHPYAGASAPTGYFLCDGSAVSRTTYSDLFTVIGTTYGPGDGSTTFNIPDLRQRFPLGKSSSGTGSTLGGTGGSIDHVHSVDPPNTTSTASANINNVTLLAGGSAAQASHTHDLNIAAFNSASANAPFLSLNYIIKF